MNWYNLLDDHWCDAVPSFAFSSKITKLPFTGLWERLFWLQAPDDLFSHWSLRRWKNHFYFKGDLIPSVVRIISNFKKAFLFQTICLLAQLSNLLGNRHKSSFQTSWHTSAHQKGNTQHPSKIRSIILSGKVTSSLPHRTSGRWPGASRPRPPCSAGSPWWRGSPRNSHQH